MNRRDVFKMPLLVAMSGLLGQKAFGENNFDENGMEALVGGYFRHANHLADQFGYSSGSLKRYFEKHVLMLLSFSYVQVFGASIKNPQWLPYIPFYLPWGIPNPDDIYKNTFIDPDAFYCLRGKKGNATIAKLTLKEGGAHLGEISSGRTLYEIDINQIESDGLGGFEIYLGKDKPPNHSGQFYQLHPGTTQLMYRSVTKNINQSDPEISIERLAYDATCYSQDVFDLDKSLLSMFSFAEKQLEFLLKFKKKRIDLGSDYNFIFDEAQVNYGGMPDQKYLFCTFSLQDDEVLVLESEVPGKCKYWNAMLFDEFCNGINAVYHQSSLNDQQVRIDEDGAVRVVVSSQDPGVHNWLDTCGWPSGGIMWRWNNADSYPVPRVKKMKRRNLFDSLPAATPKIGVDERKGLLSDRIHHYQNRLQ